MSRRLLEAGEDLANVLAAENAALAARDIAGAGRLLADKQRALAAFEALAGPADPCPLAAALGRRIRNLAAENRRLLERALVVQGRVLEAIARAVPPSPGECYRVAGRRAGLVRPPPVAVCASA